MGFNGHDADTTHEMRANGPTNIVRWTSYILTPTSIYLLPQYIAVVFVVVGGKLSLSVFRIAALRALTMRGDSTCIETIDPVIESHDVSFNATPAARVLRFHHSNSFFRLSLPLLSNWACVSPNTNQNPLWPSILERN